MLKIEALGVPINLIWSGASVGRGNIALKQKKSERKIGLGGSMFQAIGRASAKTLRYRSFV